MIEAKPVGVMFVTNNIEAFLIPKSASVAFPFSVKDSPADGVAREEELSAN